MPGVGLLPNSVLKGVVFDEIAIGTTATTRQSISQDDIDLFAALSGDLTESKSADKLLKSNVVTHALAASSISKLLSTRLPGPGMILLSLEINVLGRIVAGNEIITNVTVREKQLEGQRLLLDCVCTRGNETVVKGTAKVRAPTTDVIVAPDEPPELRLGRHLRFHDLIHRASSGDPVSLVAAYPCDGLALSAVAEMAAANLISPTLIGPREKILDVAAVGCIDISRFEIVDAPTAKAAAEQAVVLVRAGKADLLMKGSLHTDEFMNAVVASGSGLRTARRMSHVYLMDVPSYPRPLLITDAALNIAPTLTEKRDIIQNAIDLAHVMGIEMPRVAILSAVETINPALRSTLDAASLCKMADRGQIVGGLLDGPLAFDNAVDLDAAREKGIISTVAGRADVLVVPDLEAGNMLAKQLSFLAGADAAGVVVGATIPIILTSRADSERTRLASCAVAVLMARWQR